jgi:hypothetical protein
MRIDVSGVFNSCETFETKSVFFCASASCRRASLTTIQPPNAIAAIAAAMSRISVRRMLRALSCSCSGRCR